MRLINQNLLWSAIIITGGNLYWLLIDFFFSFFRHYAISRWFTSRRAANNTLQCKQRWLYLYHSGASQAPASNSTIKEKERDRARVAANMKEKGWKGYCDAADEWCREEWRGCSRVCKKWRGEKNAPQPLRGAEQTNKWCRLFSLLTPILTHYIKQYWAATFFGLTRQSLAFKPSSRRKK